MLQLLRVTLPVPVEEVPQGAVLRNFEPHRDEAAWLEQNNAAFANHPEQGAWRQHDLDERTEEPWFDPSGFLPRSTDVSPRRVGPRFTNFTRTASVRSTCRFRAPRFSTPPSRSRDGHTGSERPFLSQGGRRGRPLCQTSPTSRPASSTTRSAFVLSARIVWFASFAPSDRPKRPPRRWLLPRRRP